MKACSLIHVLWIFVVSENRNEIIFRFGPLLFGRIKKGVPHIVEMRRKPATIDLKITDNNERKSGNLGRLFGRHKMCLS